MNIIKHSIKHTKVTLSGKSFIKVKKNHIYLIAKNPFYITDKQILSIKKKLQCIKQDWKNAIEFKLNTIIAKTKKSAISRMGSGKGNIEYWINIIKKGSVILNINKNKLYNFNLKDSKNLLKIISFKLPVDTYIIESF